MTDRPREIAAPLPVTHTTTGGTWTFLFTDIEGSTRIWEREPAAMAQWLVSHDRILTAAIEAHHGQVFKHTGDGLCAVFRSAGGAVRAACEIQRGLVADRDSVGPLRVRVALHSGDAVERSSDFYGPSVNRCARLLGVAHGGQVLVSTAAAALLREGPTAGDLRLVDLGDHRLRDLTRAERIWQVGAPGLDAAFPPLRSLDVFAHNLPVQRSSFIGRREELQTVRPLIHERRLVALVGVGGAGKTRLALEVAVGALERFPDGVFFADLSDVVDAGLVPSAFASAVGAPPDAASTDERLHAFLGDRRVLIVVDNCEHVIDDAARTIDRMLARCPHVHVLATSREPLALEDERVWRVPPLGVPERTAGDGTGFVEEIVATESVRLFVDRALAVRSDFVVTCDNAGDVAEICRRLDGLPLAIELAAARVAHLSPREILERLADRFRLLSARRTQVLRQQTLHAVLDWSHELLDADETVLFRRLAVFAGGWTLDAAEAVSTGGELDAGAVVDVLGKLVLRSLVVVEDRGDHTRYRMLETVRMYAFERLGAAGEGLQIRVRHAEWYLQRAERSPDGDDVAALRPWFGYEPSDLVGDLDNLREAADWWREQRQYDAMVRIAAAAIRVFQSQGRYDEPDAWLRTALEHLDELSPVMRSRCHSGWAEAAEIRGRFFEANERARAAIAAVEDPADAGGAYSLLVANLTWSAPAEAEALIDRAAEWTTPLGSLADGYVRYARASLACARHEYAEAVRLMANIAWRDEQHVVYGNRPLELAVAYLLYGDPDRATAIVDYVAEQRDVRRWRDYYVPLVRGVIAATRGNVVAARTHLGQALTLVRRWKIPLGVADCVLGWAVLRFHAGDVTRASELLGAIGAATGGGLRSPMSMTLYRHYIGAVRAMLGSADARRARDLGAASTLDAAIERESSAQGA